MESEIINCALEQIKFFQPFETHFICKIYWDCCDAPNSKPNRKVLLMTTNFILLVQANIAYISKKNLTYSYLLVI